MLGRLSFVNFDSRLTRERSENCGAIKGVNKYLSINPTITDILRAQPNHKRGRPFLAGIRKLATISPDKTATCKAVAMLIKMTRGSSLRCSLTKKNKLGIESRSSDSSRVLMLVSMWLIPEGENLDSRTDTFNEATC